MDQRPYPGPPLLFHIRMSLLFLILWVTDVVMLMIAVESNLANGVSCMVLFACEVRHSLFLRCGIFMPFVTVRRAAFILLQHCIQIHAVGM